MTTDDIVWDSEAEKVDEDSADDTEYFNPPLGRTKITFKGYETYRDQKEWDEEECDYIAFDIEVDGEEKVWTMKKTYSMKGKYGQIAKYAAAVDGLEGETITWMRRGEGTETTHVLLDLDHVEDAEDEQEAILDDEE